MFDATETLYFARKWYALFPGIVRPVSGTFLAGHYARRAAARGLFRTALDAAVGLGFHLWVPFRARTVARKFSFDREWTARAVAIARRRFADPNDIALFRIGEAAELDVYIRRFEDAALNKRINPLGWTRDCALMDKARFAERCEAAGLAAPQVFAIGDARAQTLRHKPDHRPLLLKPARGEGGRGVTFVDPPTALTAADLTRWLATLFAGRSGTWLLQERIAGDPAIADLALNALSTARITTILDESGRPEPVSAVLRLASDPAAQVDNMKAGGLLAPIDLASGRLGIACKGYGGGDYPHHPVTGAPIAGRTVPHWEQAKALAVDAHVRAFADYAIVGWDTGIGAAGPVLIEGNGKPGVLMPQRAGRQGLGGQRYGELLAFHLARTAAGSRK